MKKIIFFCIAYISITFGFSQSTTNQDDLTFIELGRKLENPYNLDNMREAYVNKRASVINFPRIDIETNHTYIRFLPKNEQELEKLYAYESEDFILFDHPLDYEIVKGGNFYHDPTIPKDKPTWLYTVVKSDYQKPVDIANIQFEKLEELFLPPDVDQISDVRQKAVIEAQAVYYELLEDEALEITNNQEPLDEGDIVSGRASKYRPSGTIKINTGTTTEGVPDVKVRVRRWFKTSFGTTDNQGNFSTHKRYRKSVNFGVIYKNDNARILAGPLDYNFILYGGAFFNGPKTYHWYPVSSRGASSYEWGGIMRALHDYHNRWSPEFNIPAPPRGLRIAAYTISGGFAPMWHKEGKVDVPCHIGPIPLLGKLLSDIYVDEERSDYFKLYRTVTHELSHTIHWEAARHWKQLYVELCQGIFSGDSYLQRNRMSAEAWADGVEELAALGKFGTVINQSCHGLDARINNQYPEVIVRDLMDNSTSSGCEIVDNVSGFTLREVFDALVTRANGNNNWLGLWRDNLIAKKPEQKEELKQYFAQWLRQEYIPCNDPATILSFDYNTLPSFGKKIPVTNSNEIILKSGFHYTANTNSEYFSAVVECNPPASRASSSEVARHQFNTEAFEGDSNSTELQDIMQSSGTPILEKEGGKEEVGSFSFYPNPTTDKLYVEDKNVILSWNIKDNFGQEVLLDNNVRSTLVEINTQTLNTGMYFLNVIIADGQSIMKTIIIE